MYKNLNCKDIEWCCKKQIKPMYNDIKDNDYFEPIKRWSKENNNIFSEIIKKQEINDIVMQYYIKSKEDISIIVVYPSALKNKRLITQMTDELKTKGTIHYTKDIDLTYYMAYNLIFQLYASEKRMKRNSDIMYKINRLGFINDGNINNIKVIVYTLKDKTKPINGQSAEYKMFLRNIFVEHDIKTTPYMPEEDMYPRGYDYLHVSDDNNQAYEYAGIFLSENSLNFLKKQKSWRMLEMHKTRNLINKIKDFFYNYSQNELEKLLIFSSGVLFSYGIREANDIDCLLLENNTIDPKTIEQLNSESKDTMDISYKGTTQFNENWEKTLNDRAIEYGAKNYHDLVTNPRFYYYFMGLKIIRLKCDLMLRFKRGRPAQFTDLLVIRQMFNFGYKLKVPETTKKWDEVNKKDIIESVDKSRYLETVKTYLRSRYYINLTTDQIDKWIEMSYNEIDNKDKMEYFSDISMTGGSVFSFFNTLKNKANDKTVYPDQKDMIKMGYAPNITIYSSDKPYLYPGENFEAIASSLFCNKEIKEMKDKRNVLRVASFNLHNFISRCNQGIAPLFGTALNPFDKPRDINKFIDLFKSIDADVLCLQELVPITKEDIKEDIKDLNYIRKHFNFEYLNEVMKSIGYEYKIISSTQQGNFYDGEQRDYYYLANGIYSKIKLEDEEVFGFKYLNRNIITCTVKYNNKKIRIFNTHLEYFDTKNSTLIRMNIMEDQITKHYNDLYNLVDSYRIDNPNIIICGDLNLNFFKKGEGFRYKNWESRTKLFRDNFVNSNRTMLTTNFSQNDQTDIIMYDKFATVKCIYSFTVFTNISDHYMIFADFI
jgi:endonuclease/exonuclease/phosphatase family metal-dependent hydrolase